MGELQLGWTGAEIVAWAWDGRPTRRHAPAAPLYGLMVNEWGWLPPGSWGTRLLVDAPGGAFDAAAVVVPALAVTESVAEPRRRELLTPSSIWVRNMIALARHSVARGYIRPEVVTAATGSQHARWMPVVTPAVDAALATRAACRPPIVAAVRRADVLTRIGAPSNDPLAFTEAFHGWLVDLIARQALRMQHWNPDLTGLRSAEATALRSIGKALSQMSDEITPPRTESVAGGMRVVARGFERLRAGATGEPLVSVRLRLALPVARSIDDLMPDLAVDLTSEDPGSPVALHARFDATVAADGAAQVDDPNEAVWPLSIELADRDDPSRWCTARDVWDQTPLALDLAGQPQFFGVLADAIFGARSRLLAIPSLRDVSAAFRTAEPASIRLEIEGAAAVLEAVDELEAANIPLLAPGQLTAAKASVRGSATPVAESDGRLGRNALVDWTVVVDGAEVDEATLERAATTGASLIQADGRWVRIDRAAARRALASMRDHRAKHSSVDAAALLKLAAELAAELAKETGGEAGAIGDDGPLRAVGWLDDLLAGLPDDRLAEGDVPPSFHGELRHYQRRGLGWLQFLERLGMGGCLADDMGLGKTPTTLAHLAGRPGPHLVLCPLSVVRNWQSEAARFAPFSRVHVHHGIDRRKGDALAARIAEVDIVITTYGLAVRDIPDLITTRWSTVVLDEAQAVKNAHTHSARMVRKLNAVQKLALTGTPVENRLGELWAILDVVNPGLLGSERQFHERWTLPIERHGDEEVAAALRRLTGPFVLRRTKADRSLVPDLPDKVEQLAWASLTREQATMYQAVVDRLLEDAEATEGMKRRGLVLAALTRLKQICNHPAQATSDGSKLAGRSGKLTRFDELLTDLLDAEERALVFTQYREMGELLQRHISDRFELTVPFLHGGVTKARRDRMVDQFQAGDGAPILLVSLKAGGTGLNLTSASRVIHYDRWWNPAVEDQATDRAWRIGQKNAVFVHKMVCQGTIEERISELIDDKRRLAGMVIGAGAGEAWLSELSTSDLRDLVVLGHDAVDR